jgi:hypothetical protein
MNTTLGNKTGAMLDMTFPYVGYALCSVIILGSLGNILVIFSIYRQKILLRNNHYYLVLHLAICDLLNLLGAIAHTHVYLTAKRATTSAAICHLLALFVGPFYESGVLFMVLMSMLRCRAVFYPLRPAVSRWKLHLASVFIYVFGILCQIPPVLYFKFKEPDVCWAVWPSETLNITYTVFLSSVQFFIPVVFLGLIYWKICSELMKQGKMIKSMNATIETEEKEHRLLRRLAYHRNARAFLICFIIFVCFLVAGSPQQIAFMLLTFKKVDLDTYYDWFVVMYFLGVSAVNPLIYGASDKKIFSSTKLFRGKSINTK